MLEIAEKWKMSFNCALYSLTEQREPARTGVI